MVRWMHINWLITTLKYKGCLYAKLLSFARYRNQRFHVTWQKEAHRFHWGDARFYYTTNIQN